MDMAAFLKRQEEYKRHAREVERERAKKRMGRAYLDETGAALFSDDIQTMQQLSICQ